jgi:hypothetical protein
VGILLLSAVSLNPISASAEEHEKKPVLAKPISTQALAAKRGTNGIKSVTNLNDVRGDVANNSATNVVTGTNTLSGSFGGSSYAVGIMNSGNNVLIQNSTVVNVHIQP